MMLKFLRHSGDVHSRDNVSRVQTSNKTIRGNADYAVALVSLSTFCTFGIHS